MIELARLTVAGGDIALNAASLTAGELVYMVHLLRGASDKPEKPLTETGG